MTTPNTSIGADLCRLTVAAPRRRVDLVVPATTTIADLLPVLVRQVDPQRDHAGPWTLQRLGDGPLDPVGTPESLGLRDGEVLHLRPIADALPPLDLDDVVDGVSTAIRDRLDKWQPVMTRRLLLCLSWLTLLAVLCGLAAPGPLVPRVVLTATAALLLVVTGGVWSRALDDAVIGGSLGVMSVPFAVLGGLLLPGLVAQTGTGWPSLGGPELLAGGACGAVVGALALVVTGVAVPVLIAVITTTGFTSIAAWLVVMAHATGAQAAAVVAALAFVTSALAPTAAARLVRLRPQQIPSHPDQLQQDIEPHSQPEVLARSAVADRYLSALLTADGAVCAGSAVALAMDPGLAAGVLLGVLGTALLLRSRVLVSAWQRSATAAAGTTVWLVLLLRGAVGLGPGVLLVGLIAAGLLVAAATRLPGRSMLPYWGRAADIFETVTAIAVVPLVLVVLNAIGWARGLVG